MAERKRSGARQISEVTNPMMDPVLSRRAGINTALLSAWDEIAGADFADCTRPEKITWSRQASHEADGAFQPGILTIACEGARALFLSHAETELIARVNGFFGFPAIRQIRIVQKPVVSAKSGQMPVRKLNPGETRVLNTLVTGIEDSKLQQALKRLGTAILLRNAKSR